VFVDLVAEVDAYGKPHPGGRRVLFAIRLLEGAHGQEHEQEVKLEEAEVMTSGHFVRRFV